MKESDGVSNQHGRVITTDVFRADRRRFAMLLMERHGQAWMLGGFFLFIVALILGFAVDYRLFILAILLVCLIAPALLLLLYYNYGLKGDNFLNILDHRIEIAENSLLLYLQVKGEEEDEKEEWRCYDYHFSSFSNYTVGKDYVIFPMVKPKEGFIYLPVEAFNDQEDFSEAVKRISKRESNEDN